MADEKEYKTGQGRGKLTIFLSKRRRATAEQAQAPPEEREKGLIHSRHEDEDLVTVKPALTIEFYEIDADEALTFGPSLTELPALLANDAFLARVTHPYAAQMFPTNRYMEATAEEEEALGGPPDGERATSTGSPIMRLAKMKAIDAAMLARFSTVALEGGRPITGWARADNGAQESVLERFDPGGLMFGPSGLAGFALRRGASPYNEYLLNESKQGAGWRLAHKLKFHDVKGRAFFIVPPNQLWEWFSTFFDEGEPDEGGYSYKVTEVPDPAGPRVTPSLSGGTLRLFLKPLPQIIWAMFSIHYWIPYPFWMQQNNSAPYTRGPMPTGVMVATAQRFNPQAHQWHNPYYVAWYPGRSHNMYWSGVVEGLSATAEEYGRDTALVAPALNGWFEENKIPLYIHGYGARNWNAGIADFPSVPERPRYYDDAPVSFYYDGRGGVNSNRWEYPGQFVGGFAYKGKVYYVWRQAQVDVMEGPMITTHDIHVFSWSSSGRQIEPDTIWTGDGPGQGAPNANNLHTEEDRARPDHVIVPAGSKPPDVTYDQSWPGSPGERIRFHYRPKYVIDFNRWPRRFQT